jgi:hypothetical protein
VASDDDGRRARPTDGVSAWNLKNLTKSLRQIVKGLDTIEHDGTD